MGVLTVQTVKKFEFPKSKMVDGRHSEKNVKSPYLSSHMTDMDEIWHDGADWPFTGDRPLKFRIFQSRHLNHKNRGITAKD